MATAKGSPVPTSTTPGEAVMARRGILISFGVAIITIVVGILVVTCVSSSASERDGAPTALVRFTGIGWNMHERLEALARDERGRSAGRRSG